MKILTEQALPVEVVSEQARVWCGQAPTNEFFGATLDTDTARRVADALNLPGGERERVVVCAFDEVLLRAADVLLRSVEEQEASLFFATPSRLPETLRSRFRVTRGTLPTMQQIYMEFGSFGQDKNIETVISMYPEMSPQRLRRLYDEFAQSISPVNRFLDAVQDGNVESALKATLEFEEPELEILYAELESQLLGTSILNHSLTRIERGVLLRASTFKTVSTSMLPSSEAAMLLFMLL